MIFSYAVRSKSPWHKTPFIATQNLSKCVEKTARDYVKFAYERQKMFIATVTSTPWLSVSLELEIHDYFSSCFSRFRTVKLWTNIKFILMNLFFYSLFLDENDCYIYNTTSWNQ